LKPLNTLPTYLPKNGFTVEKGIAGIPTAWMAKWGSGSPVIALGSDLDCIPKASRSPVWHIKTDSRRSSRAWRGTQFRAGCNYFCRHNMKENDGEKIKYPAP
jgi:metal-dependent amidase/aminoacylase/carboxypeptidase family protein